MNDRFKFRVPVFDEGKFLCFHFFNAIDGADYYREIGPYAHGKEEQCTCLKDKNGKIIYENDIVKNGKEIAEVLWNKNGCFELVGKCFVAPTYLTNLKNWEIIGNIHQDSHLLLEDK